MSTISERFHAIANLFNCINMPVGCTKLLLKDTPLEALDKDQLKTKTQELIVLFDKVEQNVMAADKLIIELKTFIYKNIDKNTNI